MRSEIDIDVDVEIEHHGVLLDFQAVSVTGTIVSGVGTQDDPPWCNVDLCVGLTVEEVQDQMVEMFTDEDKPVPPWALTDGEIVLDKMKRQIETHVDLG